MFQRKLLSVGYPGISQFNINDESSVRDLVTWLEDNVFFTDFSDEFMSKLHDVRDPKWNQVFIEYLNECSCPFDAMTERTSCVDWLLREAIRLVAEDPETSKLVNLNVQHVEVSSKSNEKPITVDVENQTARNAINKMADLLHVIQHPNPHITVQAIASLLSTQIYKKSTKAPGENIDRNDFICLPLEKVTLGFDTRGKHIFCQDNVTPDVTFKFTFIKYLHILLSILF